MTYADIAHRIAFRNAIFTISGSHSPRRKILNHIGEEAARIARRKRAWRGSHLYVLLHWEKWPDYKIHIDLFHAVMKLAGSEALNGRERVMVYAHGVREGAVVLLRSRKCARSSCRVHFVGAGKYCSDRCRELRAKSLRKQAALRRKRARLLKRRRGRRARNKSRDARGRRASAKRRN